MIVPRGSISLRELRADDAPALQPLASNPILALTTRFPSPYPPNGAEEFVARALANRAAGTHVTFAILLDGAPIGTCALMEVDRELAQAEIGYWIGVPYWGRGYGLAAAAWVVDWAFENLPLEQLIARVVEGNVASERILRRLGFDLLACSTPAETAAEPQPGTRTLVDYRLAKASWSGSSSSKR